MTRNAANAMAAWNTGARRRRKAAAIERVADAAAVTGAAMLVNATSAIELGLPAGRPGAVLGATILAGALAWMSRQRKTISTTRPAIAARAPEPAWWTAEEHRNAA